MSTNNVLETNAPSVAILKRKNFSLRMSVMIVNKSTDNATTRAVSWTNWRPRSSN